VVHHGRQLIELSENPSVTRGIAKAKAEGKYQGRQPTARRKASEVMRLKSEGKSANDIVRTLGISRASVFRIIAEGRQPWS